MDYRNLAQYLIIQFYHNFNILKRFGSKRLNDQVTYDYIPTMDSKCYSMGFWYWHWAFDSFLLSRISMKIQEKLSNASI